MDFSIRLSIPNISCHHCTNTIMRETKDLPGVVGVEADVNTRTATYTLRSEADLTLVKETLAEIGYPAVD